MNTILVFKFILIFFYLHIFVYIFLFYQNWNNNKNGKSKTNTKFTQEMPLITNNNKKVIKLKCLFIFEVELWFHWKPHRGVCVCVCVCGDQSGSLAALIHSGATKQDQTVTRTEGSDKCCIFKHIVVVFHLFLSSVAWKSVGFYLTGWRTLYSLLVIVIVVVICSSHLYVHIEYL